uniref:Uncharacterized protein n=1 Tax=Brassica oleracea var. oleracea TaxID=109376 RepID=A0A0D3CX66_BRAOL
MNLELRHDRDASWTRAGTEYLAQELSSARKSLLESDLVSKANRCALYLCVRARRLSDRQAVCTD